MVYTIQRFLLAQSFRFKIIPDQIAYVKQHPEELADDSKEKVKIFDLLIHGAMKLIFFSMI